MKDNENDYLNKLFASSSDVTDEAEVAVPLVDVPEKLSANLHAIADTSPVSAQIIKPSFFRSWPKVTSIAASLFVAVMGFQFYQQQQTLKQLEQAQADLATALHYLGEANRITRAQVLNSLNDNMKRATVTPAVSEEQERRIPEVNQLDPETKLHSRSL